MTEELDKNFSGDQFTSEERRRLRRLMVHLESLNEEILAIRPMVRSYTTATALGRIMKITIAWLLGVGVAVMSVLQSLKSLGWWRGP